MNTFHLLIAARDVIADPKRWCQNALALTATGEQCFANSKHATQWCGIGALEYASKDLLAKRDARLRLHDSALVLFPESDNGTMLAAAAVNDQLGHEAIIRVFDHAIDQCRPPPPKLADVIPLHIATNVVLEGEDYGNA